ncbi:endolytic transglycosylase MltG [Kribbella sp. NBC_01245]|uniref:endolytic transglycosylase MltG n=1 Tax=Kribbella sp. NBC_01245 TaxID=2903578 RepID=UPI002E2AEFC6|nr:endolytic transglycosylase MltG [Kribbella sp. NBC_01245]
MDEDSDLNDDLGLRAMSRADRRAESRKLRARKSRGCLAVVISMAVVAALVVGAVLGFGRIRDKVDGIFAAPDYTGPGSGSVTVEIAKNSTTKGIGEALEAKDVVKSAKAFERVARKDSQSLSIQAGTYTMRKKMSAEAALALMLDPKSSIQVRRVSIPAGKTLKQAAALLQASKAAKLPAGSVAAALEKPSSLGLPSYSHGSAEGFLYPGTYDLPKNATATSILRQMTMEYTKAAIELDMQRIAQAGGPDPWTAVRVASIVGAETNRKADYPKVSRVIYNRLNAGMRLQMDSTVHYVAGRDGKVFTSKEAREYDSPYNTYKYEGLPPGPINSPTRELLQAALHPAKGSWLYFTLVDLDTGETAFASSLAEHQTNVNKLQAWCRAHKGRC